MKTTKKYDTESLGGRLKGYEAQYENEIPQNEHLIVRIDGHKFSKYTKGMNKPFDSIFSKAMEETTKDLLDEFGAYTVYTQSDEITMILPSLMNTDKHKGQNKPFWTHTHSGRVQKIVSLVAGFTTMSFNKHFKNIIDDIQLDNAIKQNGGYDYITKMYKKIGSAWFDARVYGVPSDEEAFNSILWRVRDCIKNSKSTFAQTYCSHKELQNKNGVEQIQYCLEKTGRDWNDIEAKYKYGILIKKETYMKDVEGQEPVQRSRVVTWSENLSTFDYELVEMVLSKYKYDKRVNNATIQ